MIAVYPDFDVEPVVDQKDRVGRARIAAPARQFRRIGKPGLRAAAESHCKHAVFNRIARRVRMTPLPQADGLIEEAPGIGNHLRAARGIIDAPLFRAVPPGTSLGPIDSVIQASPAPT